MKVNRYKKVQKTLRFYCNNFGFRKPYQVLLDGTLCFAALENQINIQEQFTSYLGGEVKLLTTPCIVLEVESFGSKLFGVSLMIKKFASHQCGHFKSPVSGSQCILDMIEDNKHSRYIIATQDRELQDKCRQIKGIPLMYLHMKTPTLEPPSEVTIKSANEVSSSKFDISKYDKEKLTVLEKETEAQQFLKKKKRKGGPNPLSCKKKKKTTPESEISKKKKEKTKKRKRNRSRLVQKIKKELITSAS